MEKFRRTLLMWNEIPIYMTIPRLHKCRKCKEEKRQFIGHDENGAESVVKKTEETPPNNQEPIETHCSQDETSNVQPEVSNVHQYQVQESIDTASNNHNIQETIHNKHPTTEIENEDGMDEDFFFR